MGPLYGGRLIVHGFAAVNTGPVLGRPEGPRVGAQRAAVVVCVAGPRGGAGPDLLVLFEVQHGQRHVEVLTLGTDVVGRVEAAVLLYLEVIVDQASPHHPAQDEAQHAAAHYEVDTAGAPSHGGRPLLPLQAGAGELLAGGASNTDCPGLPGCCGAAPLSGPRTLPTSTSSPSLTASPG